MWCKLKINNLTFSYGFLTIFEHTNFVADENQLTVIMGESGIGKSTLLDIIAMEKQNGLYFYEDKNMFEKKKVKKKIYYIKQDDILFHDLKIIDQWKLLMEKYQSDCNLDRIIKLLQLEDICYQYPQGLSGGEKQRVLLVNAFIIQKPILLFDEPTASLNQDLKLIVHNLLMEYRKYGTVIVTSHDELFQDADRLYQIENKKLIEVRKSSARNKLKETLNNKKNTSIHWMNYFLKIKSHHLNATIFKTLSFSFMVAFIVYAFGLKGDFISNYQETLNSYQGNQLLVYKSIDRTHPALDYENLFPLIDKERKQIEALPHVTSVIDKYLISTDGINIQNGDYYGEDIIITKNNKTIFDSKKIERSDETPLETIQIEDYDFSSDYSQINYLSNDKNGIYIHQSVLDSMRLNKKDIKGSMIHMKIAVPISNLSGFSNIAYIYELSDEESNVFEDEFIPVNTIVTTPIYISVPIVGIVKSTLPNSVSYTTSLFYMPHEEIEKIIKENIDLETREIYYNAKEMKRVDNIKDATKSLVYTPYQSSVVLLQIDDMKYIQDTINQLKDIGFTVTSDYLEYESLGMSIILSQQVLEFCATGLFVFIVILVCIKQFFRNENEENMNQWLYKNISQNKKEIFWVKVKKYIVDFVISFTISIVCFKIMENMTLKFTGTLYPFHFNLIIYIIILCFLLYLVIPLIWEGLYDRN